MQDSLTIEMYVLQVNLVSEQFAKVVVLISYSFFLSLRFFLRFGFQILNLLVVLFEIQHIEFLNIDGTGIF